MMASTNDKPASLLNREAQGGDIALGGFDFQTGMILCRIPAWLRQDGFISTIWEASGDAEARFFAPDGEQITFCEFKDHKLTPVPFWEEIDRFRELSDVRAFHRFELVCRGLSSELLSLVRQFDRVRAAYPFYDAAPEVQDQSFRDLEDLVESRGGKRALTRFMFERVFIDGDASDAESHAEALYAKALCECFPAASAATSADLTASFQDARSLLLGARASEIPRDHVFGAVWSHMPTAARPADDHVSIHTEHNEWKRAPETPAIVLPWKRFFGGLEREFPPSVEWQTLVDQADSLRGWFDRTGRPRVVQLTGQRRLSQSLALGASLSAVAGFQLQAIFRGATWCTHDEAVAHQPFEWKRSLLREGVSTEVAVSIGIPRSIRADVESHLSQSDAFPHLALESGKMLSSDAEAAAATTAAKFAIAAWLQETGASVVHLFLSTPSPLALFLGHRLNATGTVHCYEFLADKTYARTCTLLLG